VVDPPKLIENVVDPPKLIENVGIDATEAKS
jgi:hypothetical protein